MAPDPTTGLDAETKGDEPLISPELAKTLGLNLGDQLTVQQQAPAPELGKEPPATESTLSATEPEEELREAARKAGDEEGYLRARRELEERTKDEVARNQQVQDFARLEQNFRDRIGKINSPEMTGRLMQANTAAEIQGVLKEIADEFNSHHADGLKLYEVEATTAVAQDYTDQLFEGIGSALGEDAKASILKAHNERAPQERTWQTFVNDLVSQARTGTLTEAKANEIAATAVAKVAKDEKWLRARLSQVSSPGATGSTSVTPSDDTTLLDRYSRGEAVDAKLVEQALARLSDAKIIS